MAIAAGRAMSGPDVSALRAAFGGEVVAGGDSGYDVVRPIWNAYIDRRPAAFARCRTVGDVVSAVRFARDRDLLVSIRGGGHNVAGSSLCDGGLVIDLSEMKRVEVDAAARRARVEPGVRLGELDAGTMAHGLSVASGINTTTGVAGLTLGGGIGWQMRRWGLTCDALSAATLVTAGGDVVRTSETEEPELLWGLRGGGGNFGVVAEFEFELHPLEPEVYCGLAFYPAERAGDVLSSHREWAAGAPREATTILSMRSAPPAPWVPASLRGAPVIGVLGLWCGDTAAGEAAFKPLRQAAGRPLVDTYGRHPFIEHQALLDATVPAGRLYYWRSEFLPPLTDRCISVLEDWGWRMKSPHSYTLVAHMGAAIRDVAEADSAFSGRDAEYAININAVWTDPADRSGDIEWVRGFHDAVKSHGTGRAYVNFMMDEGADRVVSAYGAERYARLGRLKAGWDPDNFFRLNQNVRPAAGPQPA